MNLGSEDMASIQENIQNCIYHSTVTPISVKQTQVEQMNVRKKCKFTWLVLFYGITESLDLI